MGIAQLNTHITFNVTGLIVIPVLNVNHAKARSREHPFMCTPVHVNARSRARPFMCTSVHVNARSHERPFRRTPVHVNVGSRERLFTSQSWFHGKGTSANKDPLAKQEGRKYKCIVM